VGQAVRWGAFCLFTLVLYWPALGVGLLSDDFVLVRQALAWNVGPVTPTLFRPVPLLIWGGLLHAGAGPAALHLLNILLHGTNAFLSSLMLGRWLRSAQLGFVGGILVGSAPLAPEAVVWSAGVFDLLAATFILAAIAIANYDRGPDATWRVRLLCSACVGAAVLSKETAAVGPILVLLDAWMRGALRSKVSREMLVVAGLICVFGVARLIDVSAPDVPTVTKYVVQRALFTAFGSLAVPFHTDVMQRLPYAPIFTVSILLAIMTRFWLSRGERSDLRTVTGAALWIVLAVALAGPILWVPGDLQASRYLYLAAPGWAGLILAASTCGPFRRSLVVIPTYVGIAVLVFVNVYATRIHVGPWLDAAAVRDTVDRSASANVTLLACSSVSLSDVPDSIRGAYIFRNGIAEALEAKLDIVVTDAAPHECSFRWDAATDSFIVSE